MALIGQLAQESQQQGGFARTIGTDNGSATAHGHSGPDFIQNTDTAALHTDIGKTKRLPGTVLLRNNSYLSPI